MLIERSTEYSDNEYHYANPIPTINANYLKSNELINLDSLIHHFNRIAVKNDVLTYLQSAGVLKYLFEKYGLAKMKLLWTNGFQDFKTIYGISIQHLEIEWRQFLKSVVIPKEFNIDKLKEGCG